MTIIDMVMVVVGTRIRVWAEVVVVVVVLPSIRVVIPRA